MIIRDGILHYKPTDEYEVFVLERLYLLDVCDPEATGQIEITEELFEHLGEKVFEQKDTLSRQLVKMKTAVIEANQRIQELDNLIYHLAAMPTFKQSATTGENV